MKLSFISPILLVFSSWNTGSIFAISFIEVVHSSTTTCSSSNEQLHSGSIRERERWHTISHLVDVSHGPMSCGPKCWFLGYSRRHPSTVELLQDSFTKPWRDLYSTVVPDLEEVALLLKENPPPTPSRKTTGSDSIPAWD